MNNYKNLIRNQENRIKVLEFLKFVPDGLMLKIQYWIKLGRKLNLKNPERYTEKLQWYKLNYRDPLMTVCADKYRVREYIKKKKMDDILIDLIAVYNNETEINLDDLPNKFVMKTTNGSGTNYFCMDKSKFDINSVKSELKKWMKRNNFTSGREWCYKEIEPKIVVESLLEDSNNEFDGINDYKFMCFDGEPKYIVLDVDRHIGHKRNIYDINWNLINVSTDYPNINRDVKKPEGLEEMLKITRVLSEGFPCVRVDLYWVNGKPYFGELTFYPWTGYVQFDPDEFDYILGKEFVLPKKFL